MIDEEVVINHSQLKVMLGEKVAYSLKSAMQLKINRSVMKTAPKSFLCNGRVHHTKAPQKHWYVVDILALIAEPPRTKKPSAWRVEIAMVKRKLKGFVTRTVNKLKEEGLENGNTN